MILITGLGNPGKKYQNTRHNLGFKIVNRLVKPQNLTWQTKNKFKSQIASKNSAVIFLKPQTYVNRSGDAVSQVLNFYKIKPDNLWVIHDDIDLPLEAIKIQIGGQSAGHHGIESIIFKTAAIDFVRFRIGIGRPKDPHQPIKDYVLSPFPPSLKDTVNTIIEKAVLAVNIAIKDGLKKAMNEFN